MIFEHVTWNAEIPRGGFYELLLPNIVCTDTRINNWLQVCISEK